MLLQLENGGGGGAGGTLWEVDTLPLAFRSEYRQGEGLPFLKEQRKKAFGNELEQKLESLCPSVSLGNYISLFLRLKTGDKSVQAQMLR